MGASSIQIQPMAQTSPDPTSTAISPLVTQIIQRYADATRPAVIFLVLGTAFPAMLFPLLLALFYFSNTKSRRRPMFLMVVFIILLGLTLGMWNGALMVGSADHICVCADCAPDVLTFLAVAAAEHRFVICIPARVLLHALDCRLRPIASPAGGLPSTTNLDGEAHSAPGIPVCGEGGALGCTRSVCAAMASKYDRRLRERCHRQHRKRAEELDIP